MQWEFVVALVLAIPVVLFPVAFVWYLNIGGMAVMLKEARKRRTARDQVGEKVSTGQKVVK